MLKTVQLVSHFSKRDKLVGAATRDTVFEAMNKTRRSNSIVWSPFDSSVNKAVRCSAVSALSGKDACLMFTNMEWVSLISFQREVALTHVRDRRRQRKGCFSKSTTLCRWQQDSQAWLRFCGGTWLSSCTRGGRSRMNAPGQTPGGICPYAVTLIVGVRWLWASGHVWSGIGLVLSC